MTGRRIRGGWPSAVGNGKASADRVSGKLIDRVAACAPIAKLVLVEAIGHMRLPFAEDRPDYRSGIELTAIDPHRAAEAAANLEGGFDDGVAGEMRRDGTIPAARVLRG